MQLGSRDIRDNVGPNGGPGRLAVYRLLHSSSLLVDFALKAGLVRTKPVSNRRMPTRGTHPPGMRSSSFDCVAAQVSKWVAMSESRTGWRFEQLHEPIRAAVPGVQGSMALKKTMLTTRVPL